MHASQALDLARAQFGINIGVHILFPSITIGLAWLLVYFRVRYARSGDPAWLTTYRLWTRIFALTFAMGVVTGIVMSFQFGTNWPGYMNKVGNIAGPLLGYEVLTAFFLEATFLGVMLFGMNRVPGWVHVLSAVLVASGTTLSAFWILALNSWMQTPAGIAYRPNGTLIADSWWHVIFNPSLPYRLVHMLLASGLTAAFLVAGLSAWRLLKAGGDAAARGTLRTGVLIAALLAPLQIVAGDMHGLNTLEHQPEKIAAIEAIWHGGRGIPLELFAIPNQTTRSNDYALGIPKGASLVLRHDPDGELPGLDQFGDDLPPVLPVFFAFRIMVGLGVAMLALAWFGAWRTRRGRNAPRWLLWTFASATFIGWPAVLAGWIVTEMGRQPWLVTGILKTRDALGGVPDAALGASLTAYALTYGLLLLAYVVVLTHLAGEGGGERGGGTP
jgi:cytochrome d ubiquinol oxidase subunit I